MNKLQKIDKEVLLQEAIAALLARMPNIFGVNILHGTNEYGKDIVFNSIGPLNEILHCAVVVKNTKISGDVNTEKSARNIYNQIEQSLRIPYTDTKGQTLTINRVYIITPFEIKPNVINSIHDMLKSDSGKIVFYAGNELFNLFHTYWPDFLSDEQNSVESYVKNLEKDLSNADINKLANFYDLENVVKADHNIYVERTLYEYLPAFIFDENTLKLSTQKNFDSKWTKDEVLKFVAQFDKIVSLLEHFHKWFYTRQLQNDWTWIVSDNTNQEIQNVSVKGIIKLLNISKEDFFLSWKNEIEKSGYNSNNFPKNQSFKPKSSKYKHHIENLNETIIGAVAPIIDEMNKTIIRSNINDKINDINKVLEKDWISHSLLSDCQASAPYFFADFDDGIELEINERDFTKLKQRNILLILAPAGYGKTSFCRYNALKDAQEYLNDNDKYFPIYIPLHTLNNKELSNYTDAFLLEGKISGLIGGLKDSKGVKLRLYLDGLDEVPNSEKQQKIIELSLLLLNKYSNAQIVVTARNHVFDSYLKEFPRLKIKELTHSQTTKLKEKWLPDKLDFNHFNNEIRTSGQMVDLIRVPIIASLVIMVYKKTKSISSNKADLYNKFISLYTGDWNHVKNLNLGNGYGSVSKNMVLRSIASKAHFKEHRYFSESVIHECVIEQNPGITQEEIKQFVKELLVDGLISSTGSTYFFSHLSFQEFLTAKQLSSNPNSEIISKVFKKYFNGESWWKEVVHFYIGIGENPRDVLKWLKSTNVILSDKQFSELKTQIKAMIPNYDFQN